jgi:rod shape-determining protein MreD
MRPVQAGGGPFGRAWRDRPVSVPTAASGAPELPVRASYTRPDGGPHLSVRRGRLLGALALTIPFAAFAALLAALLETSVLSEIAIAGATVDLVLVCAIAAALVLGAMDGLIAAFLGGLLVDLLVPARPLGAATFTLVLITGIAAASGSVLGNNRRLAVVALAFLLTIAYEVVLALVLVLTENAPLALSPGGVFVAALMSAIIVVPIGAAFALLERRFGPAERTPW